MEEISSRYSLGCDYFQAPTDVWVLHNDTVISICFIISIFLFVPAQNFI